MEQLGLPAVLACVFYEQIEVTIVVVVAPGSALSHGASVGIAVARQVHACGHGYVGDCGAGKMDMC